MRYTCKGCGGELVFSPKDKGNMCLNCGRIEPIEFVFSLEKKPISDLVIEEINNTLDEDKPKNLLFSCSSCGASIIYDNKNLRVACPYCGSKHIIKPNDVNVIKFESIVPFNYTKEDALLILKSKLSNSFFANKKTYRGLTTDDVSGFYSNAYVFDFDTTSTYSGTLSYTETETDSEGNSTTVTRYRSVSGIMDISYRDLALEAHSNIEQYELNKILPYDLTKMVEYKNEFMAGYTLETPDKSVVEAYKIARSRVRPDLESAVLSRHSCDHVVRLDVNTTYSNEKYKYTLLPIYTITPRVEKAGKVYINGQTGKISRLDVSGGKILALVFSILGGIAAIFALIFLLAYLL